MAKTESKPSVDATIAPDVPETPKTPEVSIVESVPAGMVRFRLLQGKHSFRQGAKVHTLKVGEIGVINLGVALRYPERFRILEGAQ